VQRFLSTMIVRADEKQLSSPMRRTHQNNAMRDQARRKSERALSLRVDQQARLAFSFCITTHRSRGLSCLHRNNRESRYSINRRQPVLISTVTAIPGVKSTSRPSTSN
jgi:hypothetical protein